MSSAAKASGNAAQTPKAVSPLANLSLSDLAVFIRLPPFRVGKPLRSQQQLLLHHGGHAGKNPPTAVPSDSRAPVCRFGRHVATGGRGWHERVPSAPRAAPIRVARF